MKYFKRLLFLLTISVLVMGIAVPASAGGKNKACGKIRPVSGEWVLDWGEGAGNDILVSEYELPDDGTYVIEYVSNIQYTGSIEGNHMLIYSEYYYPNGKAELYAVARLSATAFPGKPYEERIDVWGKEKLNITPDEANPDKIFHVKGSGRLLHPFNPRFCSPKAILKFEGTVEVDGKITTGTYTGKIVGSCK